MAMVCQAERITSLINLIAVLGAIAAAVAQSPPTSSACTSSLANLSPCLSFITTNFTISPPPQRCCSALSSVVKSNATCLCELFSSNNPLPFPINQTRALALPGACNVTTPPLTRCLAAAAPAPSAVSPPQSGPHRFKVWIGGLQPGSLPPTSSVGGISPPGDGSDNPTVNEVGAHFKTSRIVTVLAGMTVLCIV